MIDADYDYGNDDYYYEETEEEESVTEEEESVTEVYYQTSTNLYYDKTEVSKCYLVSSSSSFKDEWIKFYISTRSYLFYFYFAINNLLFLMLL